MPRSAAPVSSFPCDPADKAAGTVPVWDIGIRLFHWGLVASVVTALVTGFLAPEWWIDIHIAAGTAVAALIAFRLVLGFFGTPPARFRSFAYHPSDVIAYLADLIRGQVRHYRGHNPLGAMMVFALIGVLATLAITGVVVLGGEEKRGPLAFLVSFSAGDMAAELHEALAWAIVALIGLHVAGVLFSSWHERMNLVAAMISGKKPERPASDKASALPVPRRHRLAAMLAVIGLAVIGLTSLSFVPAAGVPRAALDPQYKTECGDCHIAFHPSLLPAASWRAVMASLDDHFGEDASLSPEQTAAIAAYLTAHAAENYDTKAANRFRKTNPEAATQITATRFWKRKHRDIPEDVFHSPAVGAQSACGACHRDAETGLFADAAIAPPEIPSPQTANEESRS
ncbi:MAG: cytochrome b/b6 domain-containing protein [Hyphomicrobiales bacterium]|nr:cytochrome b/b6 domain-containing protein [Hyphomicrobiales bacterium]